MLNGLNKGSEDRINVIAIKGFSNSGRKIHIHTHYDIVSAGYGWVRDQFKPVVEGGKLFGRGASDMKSTIAASIYVVKIVEEVIREFNLGLQGEVIISVAPDEETGGAAGAGYLVREGIITDIDYTIMPEPTSLNYVWHAHKGCLWYKVSIKGKSAHATLPNLGINAFEYMTQLVSEFMKYRRVIEERVSILDSYPKGGNRASLVLGGMCGCRNAVNIVPSKAWFTIDRRVLPEESIDEVEKEIKSIVNDFKRRHPNIDIEIKDLLRIEPSHVDPNHELINLIKISTKKVLGIEVKPVLCPGFLNTRYFIKYGMPAVAWGPGDLEQAHAPDEYVELDKLFN